MKARVLQVDLTGKVLQVLEPCIPRVVGMPRQQLTQRARSELFLLGDMQCDCVVEYLFIDSIRHTLPCFSHLTGKCRQ